MHLFDPPIPLDSGLSITAHDGASYVLSDGRTFWAAPPAEEAAPEDIAAEVLVLLAEPPAPPPVVPAEISRARFLLALRHCFGLTEGAVYALISGMPEGEEDARDLFENAQVFRRANAFLTAVATSAGKTSDDLDELFRYGAALDLGD